MKNIVVLGAGCASCKTTFKLIEEAAAASADFGEMADRHCQRRRCPGRGLQPALKKHEGPPQEFLAP
jgi:hypothetical protein